MSSTSMHLTGDVEEGPFVGESESSPATSTVEDSSERRFRDRVVKDREGGCSDKGCSG